MNSKMKNFKALVSTGKPNTVERNRERIKNRSRLRESQEIAMRVLDKLDELCWTQRKLAIELGVTPQQVTKIVSGKENLTLETQVKLQEVLNVPILATFYEKAFKALAEQIVEAVKLKETKSYTSPKEEVNDEAKKESFFKTEIKMKYNPASSSYENYRLTA